MRSLIKYTCFYCCLLLLHGCMQKSSLPSLRETYNSSDTKPFGGYVAYHMFQNCYPDNYIQTIREPFEKTAANSDDTASVYFSASQNLYTDEKDVDGILDFVYKGNTVFFAASNFDTILLRKLSCDVHSFDPYLQGVPFYRQTHVKLISDISNPADSFGYYYKPFENYFAEINTRYCRVVGYNASGKPNCIVFFWGKGKLFLHADPRVFSNYFLLKNDNYRYMQQLVQVMEINPQHVYYNQFYVSRNSRNSGSGSSSLSEIFKSVQLNMAFWLLLLMLLFYVLFGGKRRQRIIPEIKPNQNSSVAFTETIARLYLQKHDNKNVAEKMITYFHEFIRNHYFLNTGAGNKDFIVALSRKSGISEEKTTSLFRAIEHANQASTIDDYQLLSLNEQIQQFYKKKQ